MFITDASIGLMKYRTMLIKEKKKENKWGLYPSPSTKPRESGVAAEIRNRPSSIHTALKPSSHQAPKRFDAIPTDQGRIPDLAKPPFYFDQTRHANRPYHFH